MLFRSHDGRGSICLNSIYRPSKRASGLHGGIICKQHLYILPYYYTSKKSDATALRRTASVVRDRGNVLDHGYIKACCLKCADRGFTARTGSLNINFNSFKTMFHSCFGCGLGRGLCCEGSGFLGSSESHLSGGCPGNCIALNEIGRASCRERV